MDSEKWIVDNNYPFSIINYPLKKDGTQKIYGNML